MLTIVIQSVACLFSVYQSHTENKRNIYISVFLFNMSCLLVYLVTKDMTSVVSYILITVRSFVYVFKDRFKSHIIPISFVLAHVILGVISMSSVWQILPIITPSITCLYMWYFSTTQKLRLGNILCAVLWLVYNVHCGLYILCINRVVTIVSNTIEYLKNRKKITKI